ncbi:hypothetical protein PF006_g10047 [Phytophthora fragariae]|uniref:Uncharacterized protein n=1 Tax=Phytophthora fragariae TaxID=53985 RepID=A0A6A3U2Z0_9STRA|nr:hypothetical protein PF006_g10047 [Phytophthora fragariae]
MNTSPCKPGIWLTSSLPRRSQAYGSRDGYIFIVMVHTAARASTSSALHLTSWLCQHPALAARRLHRGQSLASVATQRAGRDEELRCGRTHRVESPS